MKLQIHTSASAAEVEKYLHGKHTLEAYYSTDEQEIIGDWGGKGAEMLGLKGVVTKEAFGRLVNNLHPLTGEQLTDRMRKDRRPGFDMVWNVSKSVSLVYAYTKDPRIIQALRETVDEMTEIAQKQAAVRVRVGDKNRDDDRVTEWLITAEHIHLTARPEDGYSDPHLHIHLYIPNVSYDPEEKKFKALQMGRIHEMADDLEKVATKRFAEKLEAIGLKLMPTENNFEIEGFERALVEKFSRRTMTIEKTAERLGITDPAQKAKLAALTRQNKIKDVKFSDFEPIWWGSLTPEEEKPFKAAQMRLTLSRAMGMTQPAAATEGEVKIAAETVAIKSALGSKDMVWTEEIFSAKPNARRVSMNRATRPSPAIPRRVEANEQDRRAVALAMEHLFERNSVVTDFQIVAEASTNWCLRKTTVAGLWRAVEEAPLCRCELNGRVWVTTPEIMAEENLIKEKCLLGKGRFEAINKFWQIRDEELNKQQRAAAMLMLNSTDFITAIKGDPGVGKTRVLQEIKRGVEAGMYKLIALAPRSDAAYKVLREQGFENAQTIAHLLTSPAAQAEARGAVWLVDEAALLSTPEAVRLILLAEKLEARLILAGDGAQHLPVERGHAFRLLEECGKMETARITEIQRQRGDYRRVVELILAKRLDEAIQLFQKMGGVHEMSLAERIPALAKEYVAALERGETAGVVAPTHVERREVMQGIRVVLKEKGRLKAAHCRKVTRDLDWTDSQKSDPTEYKIGLRVEIQSPVKGFKMNEQVEVVAVRDDMVRVRSLHPHQKKTRPLPLHAPESFAVYDTVEENGCEREVLRNLSWSKAQKRDAEHYEPGLVVQINAHLDGYALGEHLEVVRVSNDGVKALSSTGKYKLLPLEYPRAFSVHEKDRIEICEGEQIRITANGRTADRHRICNGSNYQVDHVTYDGTILLDNGWNLDRHFKNLEWGYSATSQGSQGQTFDRIFIFQSAAMSAGASDLRQFLVSITRGRREPQLYTDSLERLRELISRERENLMTMDLFQENPDERLVETAERQLPLAAKLGRTIEPSAKLESELEAIRREEEERRKALARSMVMAM